MAMQIEMPDAIGGSGNYLREPGKYHFVVLDTDEAPKKKGGDPIDGFKIVAEVQNGNEQGKEFDFVFRNPMPTWSDKGQEQGRKKIGACMVALGFATPDNMGKAMEVELEQAVHRHFFAEVDFERDTDGNEKVSDSGQKFLQLAWSNIYHVDDPAAANYPRNEDSLALIPKANRINDPAFFDLIRGKKPSSNGGGNGHAAKAATNPKPAPVTAAAPAAAAASVSSDLGDL